MCLDSQDIQYFGTPGIRWRPSGRSGAKVGVPCMCLGLIDDIRGEATVRGQIVRWEPYVKVLHREYRRQRYGVD